MVARHLTTPWRQPLHAASQAMFALLLTELSDSSTPLLLDSGCGNGEGTRLLAARFPGHRVIGVDKSAARLRRLAPLGFAVHDNAILLRAELGSFWRLFVAAGLVAERHWLFYPNPWPKPEHLGRRWHGHPAFPTLLATSRRIELRSNWRLYLEEFGIALELAGHWRQRIDALPEAEPQSPFERKYRAAAHPLWRLLAQK